MNRDLIGKNRAATAAYLRLKGDLTRTGCRLPRPACGERVGVGGNHRSRGIAAWQGDGIGNLDEGCPCLGLIQVSDPNVAASFNRLSSPSRKRGPGATAPIPAALIGV